MEPIVFKREGMDCPVTLIQYVDGSYGVIYGELVSKCSSYKVAAFELGACIMHSLSCTLA